MGDDQNKKPGSGAADAPGPGSSGGETGGPGKPLSGAHARAVSALQKMAKPQPRPTQVPPLEEEFGGPGGGAGGSASGFVGMLAKGQIGSGTGGGTGVESLDAGDSRMPPRNLGPGATGKYPLQMAREVSPDALQTRLSNAAGGGGGAGQSLEQVAGAAGAGNVVAKGGTRRGERQTARVNRAMVPVIFGLAGVLLAIGLWAIGAVIYMANVSPIAAEDVHYPLISWSLDVGNMGGYTGASRMMGYTMLACVPVAVGLMALAETLRRRSRK